MRFLSVRKAHLLIIPSEGIFDFHLSFAYSFIVFYRIIAWTIHSVERWWIEEHSTDCVLRCIYRDEIIHINNNKWWNKSWIEICLEDWTKMNGQNTTFSLIETNVTLQQKKKREETKFTSDVHNFRN